MGRTTYSASHESGTVYGTEAVNLATTRDGAVRFEVHAKPRAKKTRITGVRQGALAVQLAAPPVDGAANDALRAALASALGVAVRDVALVGGASSRAKLVEVRGVSVDEVRDRLQRAMA
jgi:uncharacterized protein (TIGR00251 family)